jgi:hypothetical protein
VKKPAEVEMLPPAKKRAGCPKKILDLRKLDNIVVAEMESPEQAVENVLIFDARCLDRQTWHELLRLLPELVRIRRAWKAHYLECGCVSCHKKQADYASGGFCEACQRRIQTRMRNRYRKAMQGRDLPAELASFTDALQLKYNSAQRLFNSGDE